ncbi:DNA helicase/exodeoxyribonuclease V beta subunit [Pseudacidovorax intermedius]|uniref:RecBCD enzyme subunit RecB n=1 Tax=Pseudacidovorax intermedius TaxID=433924 RepID=A0A370FTQ3_9BURK|nr:UvrD-helicase domain-containing protein [Pseudacidovorax intermedius]RDI29128.1 DNA helicase/exodeoxyribonuclease V beta subunit [Pseudacidovorax intermedius]
MNTALPAVQALDPLRFPLHGLRLIEASAGTGKTYTIALLYLRLVLGHGRPGSAFSRPLTPPEILVVTFTEAATQELRERIRARLDEAARVFAGEAEAPAGDALAALLDDTPPDARPACAHRLRVAAQWMDESAIATIHGWAWRMLREHAMGSGSLFAQTLQTDLQALQQQVLHDHWRRHYYPLDAAASRALLGCFANPEALWQAVRPLLAQGDAQLRLQGSAFDGEADALDALRQLGRSMAEADDLQEQARAAWRADRAALERLWHAARPQLNGNSYRGKDDDATFDGWLQALADWSAGAEAPDHIARFGREGAKLRKGQALPDHPALDAIDAWQQAQVAAQPAGLRAHLAVHAARTLREALAAEKLRRAELGFDDLLLQLDRALASPGGAALAACIRTRFPLALIDEFQDTDPVQYRIFRRIYGEAGDAGHDTSGTGDGNDIRPAPARGTTGLILIGDPKQAIYAFRGADIRTYLRARRDTAAQADAADGAIYALDTNFRSTAAVVQAVNRVFEQASRHPRGAFRFAREDGDPVPFVPVRARGRSETLWLEGAPAPALTLWSQEPEPEAGRDSVGTADYRAQMAEVFASAAVRWLADTGKGRSGFRQPDGRWQPLRPADIAVLVRSGTEAAAIRGALAARGLRSVYLSDRESVFATPEAEDLLRWLRAAAEPGDDRLLRTALASRSLGLPLAGLARLEEDELAWEETALRWQSFNACWLRHGVLPMVHALLHAYDLPARWLAASADAPPAMPPAAPDGLAPDLPDALVDAPAGAAALGGERRLTNMLHLAEWLQRRAVDLDGPHALIRALAQRLAEPGGEEEILRLESDAALLKVVTIHKSKGLEYPLVLLPFIAAWREEKASAAKAIGFHDAEADARVIELDGKHEEAAALADEERLAEDMRLLYVALTRARHALWLGVAPLAAGSGKRVALDRGALGQVLGAGAAIDSLAGYRAALQALADDAGDAAAARAATTAAGAASASGADGASGAARTATPSDASAAAGAPAASSPPILVIEPAPSPDARVWHPPAPPPPGAARTPLRHGHAPWWIASYSALVQQLGGGGAVAQDAPAPSAEPEDARQDQALEEAIAPADVAPEERPATAPRGGSWHAFPQGAEAGSFLHGLLDWCAQQGFARVLETPEALRDLVARRCTVRGWEAWIEPLCDWLPRWLRTPWPLPDAVPATLAGLRQPKSEMEFWMPVHRADARSIDAVVQAHILPGMNRPPLPPTQLAGMLKGFMDLVFEHDGRWWVADYKSNWLGPDDAAYDDAAIQASLLAHRYDVQAALYSLALHRLLRSRLPGYDPDTHLGGALTVYLRGADAPGHGIWAVRPPRELIEALDALLRGPEEGEIE